MKRTFYITSILAALSCYAGDTYITDAKSTKRTTRTEVVYRTNFVQVPVVCATLESGDVHLQGGHTYKLLVADGAKPWRTWGILRPTTNTNARIWLPVASVRPIQWQLVDYTPGFERTALVKQAPDCTQKAQWVVLGMGNVRPVK
jgi:hypothetical protein